MKKKKFLSLTICAIIFSALAFPEISMALLIPQNNLPNPSGGIKAILENLLKWMLGVFGTIALIGFVVSGIQYFLAAGDEKIIDTAKRNMTYSIIGVVVALAAFVIIQAVDAALNAGQGF